MSLNKDNAMHTAADDEFAALMAASSLRAPHVRALHGAIPDEAQSQLRAAAEGKDAADSGHEHAACEADGNPATVEDGSGGQDQPWTTLRDRYRQLRPVLRALADLRRQKLRAGYGDGSTQHSDWTLARWLATALLSTPQPPGLAARRSFRRPVFVESWTATPAARDCDEHTVWHCTAGGKSASTTLLWWLVNSQCQNESRLNAFWVADLSTQRLSCSSSALRTHAVLSTRRHWQLTDTGPDLILSADDCTAAILTKRVEQWPGMHAAAMLDHRVSAWMRQEHPLLHFACHGLSAEALNGIQEADASVTAATVDISASQGADSGEHFLTAACLTDLLHPAPTPFLERLCQRPTAEWESWHARRTADASQISAWHRLFLCSSADRQCTAGGKAGHPWTTGDSALTNALSQGSEPATDAMLEPACLLVAADSAVDLDPAHRQAIPAQPPPLPDLDAYAARPGSVLLLPRNDTVTDDKRTAHARSTEQTTATASTGRSSLPAVSSREPWACQGTGSSMPRLWGRQAEDGPEQHAQLWMRQHLTEGDRGKRIPAQLVYRTGDPYAITAVFNAGTDEEREWTFARELLADGLHRSVGIGDVIVWPGSDETSGQQRVFIRLRPPGGTALLSVAREDVLAFLDASQPLSQSLPAKVRSSVFASWERELTELICPSSGE